MENLRREAARPYVPSGTLERYFPAPLHRWVPASGAPLCLSTSFPPPNLSQGGCATDTRRLGFRHMHTPTPKKGSPQPQITQLGSYQAQQWNSLHLPVVCVTGLCV